MLKISASDAKRISKIKFFLLDLDGTVYLGGRLLPRAREAIELMRLGGRRLCFLTNNSSKSQYGYMEKLREMGLSPAMDEVFTSGMATVDYLKLNYAGAKVYLLGTDALKTEFKESGIILNDTAPDIVVTGFDTTLTYEKLSTACRFVRGGALLLATHPDFNCPTENGPIPDTGSFLALIKASTGKDADVICGKPYPPMGDALNRRFSFTPNQVSMTGDRMMTDIRFGINCGYQSVLTLTGETKYEDLSGYDYKPDIVINSIADYIAILG